jgi:hypothetical protein
LSAECAWTWNSFLHNHDKKLVAKASKIPGDYFVTAKVPVPSLGDGKLVDASSVLRAILATMIPPIAASP